MKLKLNFVDICDNMHEIKAYFAVFQLAITCSKLTIETLEQGVKFAQS